VHLCRFGARTAVESNDINPNSKNDRAFQNENADHLLIDPVLVLFNLAAPKAATTDASKTDSL
jgi:hypothetical protein